MAGVWDDDGGGADDRMNLYVNGILEDSSTTAQLTVQGTTGALNLGRSYDGLGWNFFNGQIDEVRIWSNDRSSDQIRDKMCKLLVRDTVTQADLECYLRFDEDSGATCFDISGFENDGTMSGFADFTAARVFSGAALGDESEYDYDSADGYSVEFTSSLLGDRFKATDDGGIWSTSDNSGIHVYLVRGAPNITRAPLTWSSKFFEFAPHYWGVFVTGGVEPTYKLEYEYNGFSGRINKEILQMAYRQDGSDTKWKGLDAEHDIENQLFTASGRRGTEYILGAYQDPRNAIQYGGPTTSEHVAISETSSYDFGDTGTLEAWVKLDAANNSSGIIYAEDSSNNDAYKLVFGTGANNNKVEFVIEDSSGNVTTQQSTTSLTPGQWYHVAGVWDNDGADSDDRMELYINGILEYNFGTLRTPRAAANITIGAQTDGSGNITNTIEGTIDEVRLWDIDLPVSIIRSTMCRKLSGTETGLVGYWRFDKESTDSGCPDAAGGDDPGTMTNFSDVITARVCSEAPIGDASSEDYTGNAIADFSTNLAHPDGDDFTAAAFGGTWGTVNDSGIHVYRVDEAPVYPPDIGTVPYAFGSIGLTPPPDWSSIDYYRYWGVFVTGGVSPTYGVVYNYDGNPSVPATEADQSELGLAKRDHYCDRTWADAAATLDTTANTLTKTGETGTEYILGGKDAPLAIALASFYAEYDKISDCIQITWTTASEVDTLGFQLWRSDTKDGPYTLIDDSFIASKTVTGTSGAEYSYLDCDVDLYTYMTYYYKLEEIDIDNTQKNSVYGPIGPVTDTVGASQVNTGKASSGSGCFIDSLQ